MKEHYLNAVRRLMDCPLEDRERLLSRLGSAVAAYLQDDPDADEAGLLANFGTPEDCAARLMEECRPAAVAAARRKKDRRHRVLVSVLAALLVIALGIAAYLWANGGLVIITTKDADPNEWENHPYVIYDYDDID